MKGRLLLAAALAAGSASAVNAAPLFDVQQTSPSIIQFEGTGTASFNSSKGTNNQFNVGSNTSLGVNASLSSTADITPSASATLDLGRGSQLQQTIGSSSNAANTIAVQSSSYSAAFNAANASEWGSSYEAYQAGGGNATAVAWKSGWESTYSQAYNAASEQRATFEASNNSDGTIKGTFTTVEGASSASNSNSSDTSWADSASMAAEAAFGVDYATADNAIKVQYDNEYEYNQARSAAYDTAYNDAKASAGFTSNSTVEVQGIGSIATINAAETSQFTVNLVGGIITDGTATANGSAGANLSTSSYATQNQASTASAFIQAFGGN